MVNYIRHSNSSGNLPQPFSSSWPILSRLLVPIILVLPLTSLLCLDPLFPGTIFSYFSGVELWERVHGQFLFFGGLIFLKMSYSALIVSDGLSEYKIMSWKEFCSLSFDNIALLIFSFQSCCWAVSVILIPDPFYGTSFSCLEAFRIDSIKRALVFTVIPFCVV